MKLTLKIGQLRGGKYYIASKVPNNEAQYLHHDGRLYDFCGPEGFYDTLTEAELKLREYKNITEINLPEHTIKEGDKVKIKIYDKRPMRWNSEGKMDKYMGQIVTIDRINRANDVFIEEDFHQWIWKLSDFEKWVVPKINLPEELFEI